MVTEPGHVEGSVHFVSITIAPMWLGYRCRVFLPTLDDVNAVCVAHALVCSMYLCYAFFLVPDHAFPLELATNYT